jgi:hypothetical protein
VHMRILLWDVNPCTLTYVCPFHLQGKGKMYLQLQFCTLKYNTSFVVAHVDGAECGGSYISHAV